MNDPVNEPSERLPAQDRLLLAMLDKEIYAAEFAAQRFRDFLERCVAGMGVRPGDRIDLTTGAIVRGPATPDSLPPEAAGDQEGGE